MRQAVIAGLALALLAAPALFSEDIKFIYGVSAGNGGLYKVGDVIDWSLSATVSGGRGIAGFGVSLVESKGEAMTTLPTKEVPTWVTDTGTCSNFISGGKTYGFFTYKNYFGVGGGGGNGGVTLSASQFLGPESKIFATKVIDKSGGDLCTGTITLTKSGWHVLDAKHGGGSVWLDDIGNSASVGEYEGNYSQYYVTATPNGTLGTVSMSLLSTVISQMGWEAGGAGDPNGAGADLNGDGRVDGEDLQLLFDQGGANIDVAADLYHGGDLTEDEQVNLRDFAVLAAQWHRTDANRANLWRHGADFDRSGTVDFHDLAYLADHWLRPVDPNAR
jgi:hypothetical protein